MGVVEIIGGIIMIVVSIALVLLVLLQESTKGGITALTGGDSYYNKNSGRTLDALLNRCTKIAAALFFIITLVVYAVAK